MSVSMHAEACIRCITTTSTRTLNQMAIMKCTGTAARTCLRWRTSNISATSATAGTQCARLRRRTRSRTAVTTARTPATRSRPLSPHVLLTPHRIRSSEKLDELRRDLARAAQPEVMHVIPLRDRLHFAKRRFIERLGQYEMSVEMMSARSHLRERHPHVKCDARFLRQDLERPEARELRDEDVEQLAHQNVFADEVLVDAAQCGACVRLIAIRELASAIGAAPQRRL